MLRPTGASILLASQVCDLDHGPSTPYPRSLRQYEQEKKQTYADIEDKESTAGSTNREIRSRTIDLEVEVKRTQADEERVRATTHREKQESVEKMEEL